MTKSPRTAVRSAIAATAIAAALVLSACSSSSDSAIHLGIGREVAAVPLPPPVRP